MAKTDEILCIISSAAYFIPFCGFAVRFARSRWPTYFTLTFACALRIVCYALGAYYNSPAVAYPSIKYLHYYIAKLSFNAIGTIFMMISYGSLYKSIVPKIFKQYNHTETAFEKFAFHYIKFPFIPFAGCLISGVILADPTLSLAKQHNGEILRKVAILILLCFNALFIYISAVFAHRYPAHKKAFRTTFASTLVFTIAVVYNIIITYNAEVGERIWPAYVFAPLPEIVSFAILSGDLQTTFLGRTTVDEMDEVATPPEKSEV